MMVHDGSRLARRRWLLLERSMRWIGGKKSRTARSILFFRYSISLPLFGPQRWTRRVISHNMRIRLGEYKTVAEDFRGPFTQTADGYFWFGTASGLVRFDGVSFVPYAPSGLKLPSRGL